ncbi:MAG: AMIN domain-containing protein, partial [Symploca sp. SIO2B6]|nr:AMIN domain-containing protein [Symploca sp. SIO2B6]
MLGGAATVLLAPSAWAQTTAITDIQVTSQNGGIVVTLQTTDGDRPQIFTVQQGNSLVADVINTQLDLPGGNGFLENDPAPGISSISVTQLDSNSIRVRVDGIDEAPVGQVSQDNGKVVFTFDASGDSIA